MRKLVPIFTLLLTFAARAETVSIAGVNLEITEFVLPNGLTVIVHENHEAPTIGLATVFEVGAVDEATGETGITHILEHMLFKGTDRIGTIDWAVEKPLLDRIEIAALELRALEADGGQAQPADSLRAAWIELREKAKGLVVPNELDRIYKNEGARGVNAFTTNDVTAYILSLPSNKLELWFLMESVRLERPVLREFYTEIENVMEERRMRTDDSPHGMLLEQLIAAAYVAHPYGRPVIGWPGDIEAMTRTATEDYFRRHYAPNRMVLSIVGDVDTAEVMRLAERYFGHFEPQPDPPPVMSIEPAQRGKRRIEVEFDAEPQLMMAWHRGSSKDEDGPVWDVMGAVLDWGRSSRLQRALVRTKLASEVHFSSDMPGDRYPCLAVASAVPIAPITSDTLETVILAELEKLATEPVSRRELDRIVAKVETSSIRRLNSNLGMAIGLGYTEAVMGDWREKIVWVEKIRAVTPEQIMELARETFTPGNLTVATLVPEASVTPEGE